MFYVSLFDSISNPFAEHTSIGKIHIKNSKDRQRKYLEIPFCNNFCAKCYFAIFQSLIKQCIQNKNNWREYRSLLVIFAKRIFTLTSP